jgi:hypothetical protein
MKARTEQLEADEMKFKTDKLPPNMLLLLIDIVLPQSTKPRTLKPPTRACLRTLKVEPRVKLSRIDVFGVKKQRPALLPAIDIPLPALMKDLIEMLLPTFTNDNTLMA